MRLKEGYPTAKVELWCGDEHHLGLKLIVRKVWSPIGERPLLEVHQRYEWTYLYAFASQQREGPLVDPTHGKCAGVLHSARELRQGIGSGKEQTHPAGSRQGRLAHGEEGSGGARRDTPGVSTLPLPGTPTLGEAVAPFQRGGSEPLLRGDRRVGGGAGSALRGPERQARAHLIVHPLPLVAASGMTNKAIQTDLI